jgi:hypothetical protein
MLQKDEEILEIRLKITLKRNWQATCI